MTPIEAFIRARLDEDQEIAERVANTYPDDPNGPNLVWDGKVGALEDAGWDEEAVWRLDEHVCRHDPDRILTDVAAKRRMLDETLGELQWADGQPWQEFSSVQDAAGDFLKLLALPYANHNDYDETWRPA